MRSVRNSLLKKCDDSGLKLIPILFAKCDEIGPVANDLAATKLGALTKAGPTDRSVASFNHWREMYDTWNETQSNDAVIRDPLLSSRYVAAVRRLGEPIAGNLRTEMIRMSVKGDSERTVEAIHTQDTHSVCPDALGVGS